MSTIHLKATTLVALTVLLTGFQTSSPDTATAHPSGSHGLIGAVVPGVVAGGAFLSGHTAHAMSDAMTITGKAKKAADFTRFQRRRFTAAGSAAAVPEITSGSSSARNTSVADRGRSAGSFSRQRMISVESAAGTS